MRAGGHRPTGRNGRLQSFFDGLWWSSATITTVGYGDVYPMTALGRIIGAFTMLVGHLHVRRRYRQGCGATRSTAPGRLTQSRYLESQHR